MDRLSDDERNLLRYYAEADRVIHGPRRGVLHQHLLRLGYIEEHAVEQQNSLILVTDAGRKALATRC